MKFFVVAFFMTLGLGLLVTQADKIRFFSPPGKLATGLTGEYDQTPQLAVFDNMDLPQPNYLMAENQDAPIPQVLGDTTAKKVIKVDLSQQRLFAYEDDRLVYNFLISSGKWHPTPTGTFHIWAKYRYTKMEGGSKTLHTYYNLPNVPYTMFFTNDGNVSKADGFGIHGTYWHHNFGHPMSHGCINMQTSDAAQLYAWARPTLPDGKKSTLATADNPGTEVDIFGVPPKE